jgi:uncharacterized lipoprotein YddW (UPF0748 family)
MRKKVVLLLLFFLFAFVISTTGEEQDMPKVSREFRAVWVATVANIDFPSSKDLTTDQQKEELIKICDTAKELNLNAIVFQVRPMCDALYKSNFEPWSEFLTGEMGKAPEPYYDPLEFLIEEAHKRGIEVHTWFNPYRAHHPSAKSPISADHISKTKPELVKEYGKHLWLDPGEPGVQDHSINVMMDVVKRYDVDGIHMDDYFYPYKENDANGKEMDFPDEPSWKKYQESGGKLSRDDWRRDSVNKFVERLYKTVKAEKPWVKVGISPFGIWRPGNPEGVVGFDQYAELYADAKLWLENGWVDYFTPQLYWAIDSKGQPYKELLKWWVEQNKQGRNIWPGNYTSKYSVEEIINQVKATREQKGATGNVHFSMKPFLEDRDGINGKMKEAVYAEPALVPASPWLDNKAPAKPDAKVVFDKEGNVKFTVNAPADDDIRQWVYYTQVNGKWNIKVIQVEKDKPLIISISEKERPDKAAITAVDRVGNESKYAMLQLK